MTAVPENKPEIGYALDLRQVVKLALEVLQMNLDFVGSNIAYHVSIIKSVKLFFDSKIFPYLFLRIIFAESIVFVVFYSIRGTVNREILCKTAELVDKVDY